MPHNGIELILETANVILDRDHLVAHPDVRPGPYVMLAVSDMGVGMTPDLLEHAFEPFFTTKEASKGSGLGLSMGGLIWSNSRVGISLFTANPARALRFGSLSTATVASNLGTAGSADS